MRRGTPAERRAISAQHPDSHLLYEQVPGTITSKGRRLRRLACWAMGGHQWTRWHAGASGWPTRRCTTCGTRQVRMDASW